jgi:hypothetical protein
MLNPQNHFVLTVKQTAFLANSRLLTIKQTRRKPNRIKNNAQGTALFVFYWRNETLIFPAGRSIKIC